MKNKRRFIKRESSGITLIALVITIIVLLILAGVSITKLTGNNGILMQAAKAKSETENAQVKESSILKDYEDYINNAIGDVSQVYDSNPGVLEGSGTEQDPFVINSIEDLVVFANNVTNGNTYQNQYVKLGVSLDFKSDKSYVDPKRENYFGYAGKLKDALTTGEGFNPIGTTIVKSDVTDTSNSFCGSFDGNGKQIINLLMNKDVSNMVETNRYALFGADLFGKVENLGVTKVNYSLSANGQKSGMAGIVVNNKGTIRNCYVTGNINVIQNGEAEIYSVGITIFNRGIIESCYNLATINGISTSNTNSSCYCAGIVSNNEDEGAAIRNCYNIGNIALESEGTSIVFAQVGGIARVQDAGNIENCYNIGDINCKVSGEIVEDSQVGGIISNIKKGKVTNVYNSGKITISLEGQTRIYVGGIAGEVSGELKGSYNVGIINNVNQATNCLMGEISGRAREEGSITNSFYLNNQPIRVNLSNSCVTTQVTSEQLKNDEILNLLNQNGTVWKKDISNVNNGYPIFIYQ